MTNQDVYDAIMANRPCEPFVYSGDGASIDGLDWQADTKPPSWKEVTAWGAAIALERARAIKTSEIHSALTASDLWAIRHVEDGISLTAERIAYRHRLRALLVTIENSEKPETVAIPDPPSPP